MDSSNDSCAMDSEKLGVAPVWWGEVLALTGRVTPRLRRGPTGDENEQDEQDGVLVGGGGRVRFGSGQTKGRRLNSQSRSVRDVTGQTRKRSRPEVSIHSRGVSLLRY